MDKQKYIETLKQHIEALDMGDVLELSETRWFATNIAHLINAENGDYDEDDVGFGLTVALASISYTAKIGDVIDAARVADYEQADFEALSVAKELAQRVVAPLHESRRMGQIARTLEEHGFKDVYYTIESVMRYRFNTRDGNRTAIVTFTRLEPDFDYQSGYTVTAWKRGGVPRTGYGVGLVSTAHEIIQGWK